MPERLTVWEYEKDRTGKKDSREKTGLFLFIKFNLICETFMLEASYIRLYLFVLFTITYLITFYLYSSSSSSSSSVKESVWQCHFNNMIRKLMKSFCSCSVNTALFLKSDEEHSLSSITNSSLGCIFITLPMQQSQRWRNSEDKLMCLPLDNSTQLSAFLQSGAQCFAFVLVWRPYGDVCRWAVRRQTRVWCTLRRWTPQTDVTMCLWRDSQSGKNRREGSLRIRTALGMQLKS